MELLNLNIVNFASMLRGDIAACPKINKIVKTINDNLKSNVQTRLITGHPASRGSCQRVRGFRAQSARKDSPCLVTRGNADSQTLPVRAPKIKRSTLTAGGAAGSHTHTGSRRLFPVLSTEPCGRKLGSQRPTPCKSLSFVFSHTNRSLL